MKQIISFLSLWFLLNSFGFEHHTKTTSIEATELLGGSFTLINDTKDKVTIHTGSGIVSLNKGGKTSISCNVGKEVCWAENGKKLGVIFKIQDAHCGQTVKLSSVM